MPATRDARLPTGTVTFLFTDIEGSTRLVAELGDRYTTALVAHLEILRDAIAGHGGAEVGTEGDAVFAAFPMALRAVAAAVDAQRNLTGATWPEGATVRVRMGLHSGEGRLGPSGYVGLDVHRAARIAAAGHGGQVLLSEATRALVAQDLPDGVRLRDLGEHRLKDLALPIRVYQLEIDGLRVEFPVLTTPDGKATNLPSQLTTFVGRQREIAELKALVGEHRLVTLTGAGGSGKTRLALEMAGNLLDRFADGAAFVDLAPIRDPALVALTAAQALGLAVHPGGDPLAAVRAHLRHRELLLLIDNFEHLARAWTIVDELLAAAPRLHILVTSRVPLGTHGEQEYDVPPFALPGVGRPADELSDFDAIALFVNRARAVRPDFTLTDQNAAAVAEITARLDGLPLAIELAASRIRVLTPQAILSRLGQRLALLESSALGRPERQRTMRGAIEWSYDLLPEPERRLFARLSVFPGGCSLEGADAVCEPGDLGVGILDGLSALVEKSLVRPLDSHDEEPRFGMLETVLEYAGDRLTKQFDADATRRRLAEFLIAFAESAESHMGMEDQVPWLNRCERELPNLRSAIQWAVEAGQAEIGLRITAALWRYWQQRGPLSEGRRALDELLGLGGSSVATRAKALGAAGGLAWWSDDLQTARKHYVEALPLARESGDPRLEMEALYNLAFAAGWSDQEGPDRAEQLLSESLAIAERLGDAKAVAKAHAGLGWVLAVVRGNYGPAIPIYERAAALSEQVGDRLQFSDTILSLGNAHRYLGARGRARGYFLRSLDIVVASGSRPVSTLLLFLIAALEGEMGHHERAARLWGAAESAREITGAVRPPPAIRLIGDPMAAARQAIGADAVERSLAEGRALDLDAAIAYAHEED